MRCNLCEPLTIAVLRDNDYLHHASLATLRASADSGCSTCTLFWTCLIRTCDSDAIKTHLEGKVYKHWLGSVDHLTDTAIRLRGELHDLGDESAETHFPSVIHVSSGKSYSHYEVDARWSTHVFGQVRFYALPGKRIFLLACISRYRRDAQSILRCYLIFTST